MCARFHPVGLYDGRGGECHGTDDVCVSHGLLRSTAGLRTNFCCQLLRISQCPTPDANLDCHHKISVWHLNCQCYHYCHYHYLWKIISYVTKNLMKLNVVAYVVCEVYCPSYSADTDISSRLFLIIFIKLHFHDLHLKSHWINHRNYDGMIIYICLI